MHVCSNIVIACLLCVLELMAFRRAHFCYDSPPSHLIRRNPYSPPFTGDHCGFSPAITEFYDSETEDMPAQKSPDVTVKQIEDFWKDTISSDMLDAAEMDGGLFIYNCCVDTPTKKDEKAVKKHYKLMIAHLHSNPCGLFLRRNVAAALKGFAEFVNRDIFKTVSLRMQAANYVRMFSDVRATKRNTTTGLRLPCHMKMLCEAMSPVGD